MPPFRRSRGHSTLLFWVILACGGNRGPAGGDTESATDGSSADSTSHSGPATASTASTEDDGTGSETGPDCDPPIHSPCEGTGEQLPQAMGLACEGETEAQVIWLGPAEARGTLTGFGDTQAFAPREGGEFLVLSSGVAKNLPLPSGGPSAEACGAEFPGFDLGETFPDPILAQDVGGETCAENETLIGTGDCSNTLETLIAESSAGNGSAINDYTEMRVTTTVPTTATSLSFDFAFLSLEYPGSWSQAGFGDLFSVWVESESWTGNAGFDSTGEPLTVDTSFLTLLDADASGFDAEQNRIVQHPDCPPGTGCAAPELQGTCLANHGATPWLTTTIGLTPGEEITLIFSIMDLWDSGVDTAVFLDNFVWGCEAITAPGTALAQ